MVEGSTDETRWLFQPLHQKINFFNTKSQNDILDSLKNQWVGELLRWEDVHTLQEILNREGLFTIKTTHMGGKLFMLKSERLEEMNHIFSNEEQWWKPIFKEIKRWSITTRPKGRLVWLQCFGVPAYAWSEEFFKKVVEEVVELIRMNEATKNLERLDLARCLVVSSSMAKIDLTQKILIGEMESEINLVEEGVEKLCRTIGERGFHDLWLCRFDGWRVVARMCERCWR
ncbi:hypothetical protein Lalb_Chr01g0012751 [Lupinus albus]|uniref:Uncharacterized protein n=1 Tax=Lupinus albus TaxID=3870 RepID=A0A6A4R5L1_LUPAL|nr:hypothetical protein Lalb_Chr01g0012751 [Lupinus albus]